MRHGDYQSTKIYKLVCSFIFDHKDIHCLGYEVGVWTMYSVIFNAWKYAEVLFVKVKFSFQSVDI